jgi:pyruvate,water dikinase
MSKFIAWLDATDGAPTARVGGKGASLARLAAAGFPVPPGFAVTVDAYQHFHEVAGLDEAMEALLALSGRPTPAEIRQVCEPILKALVDSALPHQVASDVSTAFEHLSARAGGDATFAVRSSGVSEDGAGASFAGLYESFINLTGNDAVLKAILDCYHCLWEPRAAHYRTMKGVDHSKEAMAVVVMQTVQSHVSGVAFTLNPVSGETDEIMINASWGLGEAIVSGLVTPDNYIVKKTGAIAQKDVSDKHVRIVPTATGTEQQATPAAMASAQALEDHQIRHVADTATAVELHYGCPMDIEFAFDTNGNFYLLQARPITTR